MQLDIFEFEHEILTAINHVYLFLYEILTITYH